MATNKLTPLNKINKSVEKSINHKKKIVLCNLIHCDKR